MSFTPHTKRSKPGIVHFLATCKSGLVDLRISQWRQFCLPISSGMMEFHELVYTGRSGGWHNYIYNTADSARSRKSAYPH